MPPPLDCSCEVAPLLRENTPAPQAMLYKLAIFASALLAGARAEVRGPPPGGLGARGV